MRRTLFMVGAVLVVAGGGFGCQRSEASTFTKTSQASEAKSNLNSLYVSQQSYRREMGSYLANAPKIGFQPERGNRYAYFLVGEGPVQWRNLADLQSIPEYSIIGADSHAHPGLKVPTSWRATSCPLTPAVGADGQQHGVGISGSDDTQIFVAAAVSNLDGDAELDCWSIASVDRTSASGETIPAGQPHHEQAD